MPCPSHDATRDDCNTCILNKTNTDYDEWQFVLEFYSVAPEAAAGDIAYMLSYLTKRVALLEQKFEVMEYDSIQSHHEHRQLVRDLDDTLRGKKQNLLETE